jgi:ribosomal protein S18 acetylase RimI-like enzyme
MSIEFSTERTLTPDEFIDVLKRSSLGERRPIDDAQCIAGMLKHASLLCTAWDGARLVGVARSVTDFCYCCYLSDLAVDAAYQRRGIGKELIRRTQARLGPRCLMVLLAAPKATEYYPAIGFTRHASAWCLRRDESLR